MVSFFPVHRSQSDTNLLNPVLVTFGFWSFQGAIGNLGSQYHTNSWSLEGSQYEDTSEECAQTPLFQTSKCPHFILPSPATTFTFSNLPTSPIPSSDGRGFRILSDHIVELEVPGLTVLVQLRKPLENLT